MGGGWRRRSGGGVREEVAPHELVPAAAEVLEADGDQIQPGGALAAALEGHSDPGKIWKPLDEEEASRRTVYAFIKRSMVVPMLEVLDLCDSTRSSASRNVTSVPTQALTLFNGEFVNRQARHFAARILKEAGSDSAKQIERAYRLALCRAPTPQEQAAMMSFLNQTAQRLQGEDASPEEARRRALERVCLVVLNLNEFVYPD